VRSWIGLSVVLYGFFAAVSVLEELFYAWWEVPEESMLPFMAAGAVLIAPLGLVRILKRGHPPRFQAGTTWGEAHPVYAAGIIAAPLLVLSLLPALFGEESWAEGVAWSLGGSGGVFLWLLAIFYLERWIRRREAGKRGIQPAEYRPGRLARGVGLGFAVLLGLFYAIGFAVELSDVLG
jgi:hypothetical protein